MKSSVTRRAFVSSAAALTIFNIGCTGFGTSRARRIAAGEKIRLGLIGCGGRMGYTVRYGILNEMCGEEIVCLAEPDPNHWPLTLGLVKQHQPTTDISKIRTFYDYHEMLDKMADELDAVAIATPNHHHAPAAILAMSKGLHVYVE